MSWPMPPVDRKPSAMRAARSIAGSAMPPSSRRGLCSGIGVTRTSPTLKRLPSKSSALAGPGAADDRDGLLDQARALLELAAELGELELAIADADAEIEAAARQHRQRRGVLGDAHRVVQRQDHQVGADAHALGARADRGGDHQRRGRVAVIAEVMLGDPHGIEAEALGLDDLLERLRVERLERDGPGRRIAEVVPESEVDVSRHGRAPRVQPSCVEEIEQHLAIPRTVLDERCVAAIANSTDVPRLACLATRRQMSGIDDHVLATDDGQHRHRRAPRAPARWSRLPRSAARRPRWARSA